MLRRLTSAQAPNTLLIAASFVVLLTPLYAQPAKVEFQSGSVSYIKDSSGYTFALMDNSVINPGYKIKTGGDGYAKIRVPDGSTFEVFPNSEVLYKKSDSVKDLLDVWLGKVKVMIYHLPGVPNPNNVTTPTALISVRGTVFDVDVEDLDGTTVVSLDEGVVDVRHLLKGGKPYRMVPGEALHIFPDQPITPASDKGGLLRNLIKGTEKAVYDAIYTRPGGPGGGGGNVPVANGKQGDNGNGKTTGTSPGTGSAPAPGTGSATAPPPPGGGGGG
jgi:hypothetical protein